MHMCPHSQAYSDVKSMRKKGQFVWEVMYILEISQNIRKMTKTPAGDTTSQRRVKVLPDEVFFDVSRTSGLALFSIFRNSCTLALIL